MTVIGTITIEAGTANKSYETASWYTTVEFDTQTVELKAHGKRVHATVVGRIVKEYFPSSFGGLATGGGTFTKDTMKETTYTFSWYDYQIATRVQEGCDKIVLADGFELVTTSFDHPIYCDGMKNYGIGPVKEACDCEAHTDCHGKLQHDVVEARGSYPQHFTRGYKALASGERITKTRLHHKIKLTVNA